MDETLIRQVEHQRVKWNNEFKEQLAELKKNFRLFPCAFWELYYKEIVDYLDLLLKQISPPLKILEAGCGSGKGSLLLKSNIEKLTLLDISEEALKLAQFFAKQIKNENIRYIEYIQGDLFKLPFEDNSYNLVWNAGTLEHYDKSCIKKIIEEIARITKRNGFIVIGIPNPKSLAFRKAKFLSTNFARRWLKFIPGYRFDDEKSYFPEDLMEIFESIPGYKFSDFNIVYVGSYLLRDTPRVILKLSTYLDRFFQRCKFMYLLSVKKL